METYFFDDPSLYDYYYDEIEAGGLSAEAIQTTDQTFTGTNNVDSLINHLIPDSWSLYGYSGNDSLTGSAFNDVLWEL